MTSAVYLPLGSLYFAVIFQHSSSTVQVLKNKMTKRDWRESMHRRPVTSSNLQAARLVTVDAFEG